MLAGFANATPFGEQWENFKEYVEPRPEIVPESGAANPVAEATATAADEGEGTGAAEEAEEHAAAGCGYDVPEESAICYFPAVDHAEFKWSKAALSLIVVAAGFVSSWFLCVALYTKRSPRLVGLTERFRPARWGYAFLANKYYLDALYEGVIVRAIAHPIAQGRELGEPERHRRRRQRRRHSRQARRRRGSTATSTSAVVDGAVNGSGTVANGDRQRAATRAVRQGQPVRRVCSSAPPPWAPSCS